MKREEIVAEARKYAVLKSRWGRMQRTPHRMDCYGLIILVRTAFDLTTQDFERYELYPKGEFTVRLIDSMFDQVHPPFKDGMVMLFQFEGHPMHLGILATNIHGQRSVIHCSANRGFCTEEPLDSLAKYYRAVFDFPGVED